MSELANGAPVIPLKARPHVLYRMYDLDGALLYVGITMNVEQRFSAHRNGKDWWSNVASAQLMHFPTREAALAAEQEAIRSEQPQYNVAHTPRPKEFAGRRPGRPATGKTFVARFRVQKATWDRFGLSVGDGNRAKWVNLLVESVNDHPKEWLSARKVARARSEILWTVLAKDMRRYVNKHRHLLDETDA